jgi:hypothetical protein
VDTLSDDLLLLLVNTDGTLRLLGKLRFGLAGSELVRLAAAGRVNVERRKIVVLDSSPTGDPLLDQALASMTRGWMAPTAKAWVARDRHGLVKQYLARLVAAGVLREDRRKSLGFIPVTEWTVIDRARAAQAGDRLVEIATSTGALSPEQRALGGLASAIGIPGMVFPARAGAAARKRLREIARHDPAARTVMDAAVDAADNAAVSAAIQASTDAAISAAISSSIDAATAAAISAATDAAHDAGAGGHHGGAVGGHH